MEIFSQAVDFGIADVRSIEERDEVEERELLLYKPRYEGAKSEWLH